MNLPSQEVIIQNWEGDLSKPLVSVCCITYNHEAYIEEALQGFLMQKTNFPFEVLIHDDASTDNTTVIIKDYYKSYPDIIKPIFQTDNQYSKGFSVNHSFNFPRAQGRYIAICEGDDYWVDPLKLQKQANFLEDNPDYVMSGHDVYVINKNGERLRISLLNSHLKRDFDSKEAMEGRPFVINLTRMFRNLQFEYPIELCRVLSKDTFFMALIGQYGKIKFHHDILPAAYRRHDGGVWSSLDCDTKYATQVDNYSQLFIYFHKKGKEDVAQAWLSKLKNRSLANISSTFLVRLVIKRVFKRIRSSILRLIKANMNKKNISSKV